MNREVYPTYDNAMGYKYRIRIESKKRFWSNKLKWRCVIERYFMSWYDYKKSEWFKTEKEAINLGTKILDAYEETPKGKYL